MRLMPGNETTITQPRFWLPTIWGRADFASGQTVALAMAINGHPPGIDEFSLPRRMSLVSVGIELDAGVSAGFLRFQLTRNGTPVGPTWDMDDTTGLRRLIEVTPGTIIGQKGQRIGVVWGSPPSLSPAGSIDGVVMLEVEPV